MEKLLALALAAVCGAAAAQTPASNPMPDGSRDMYLGLGAQSSARYQGAAGRKLSSLPVLQVQWSNGVFISGMTAGMHLSDDPSLEFGPLLSVQPKRTEAGTGASVGGVSTFGSTILPTGVRAPAQGLDGMDEIHARLQGGGFFNYYLAPQWRLMSTVLYGAGNSHNGALLELGLQHLAAELAPHHTLALSAGVSVANHNYNQAFFGVSQPESARSGRPAYQVAGGINDAHVEACWNWALSPSWLATSRLKAARLVRGSADSPLVERPTNVTVSAAIAYRF